MHASKNCHFNEDETCILTKSDVTLQILDMQFLQLSQFLNVGVQKVRKKKHFFRFLIT